MTSLIVLSDIHGNLDLLEVIKKRHKNEKVVYINCGDSCLDDIYTKDMISVKGNCDKNSSKESIIYSVNGVDMYITHGHNEKVKYSLDLIYKEAVDCGAKLALYGHTHIVKHDIIDGIHLINPGSIENPKRLFKYNEKITTVPTYAKIIFGDGNFECKFFHALNGNELKF